MASIWLFSRVSAHVRAQSGRACVDFVAQPAFVGFGP